MRFFFFPNDLFLAGRKTWPKVGRCCPDPAPPYCWRGKLIKVVVSARPPVLLKNIISIGFPSSSSCYSWPVIFFPRKGGVFFSSWRRERRGYNKKPAGSTVQRQRREKGDNMALHCKWRGKWMKINKCWPTVCNVSLSAVYWIPGVPHLHIIYRYETSRVGGGILRSRAHCTKDCQVPKLFSGQYIKKSSANFTKTSVQHSHEGSIRNEIEVFPCL